MTDIKEMMRQMIQKDKTDREEYNKTVYNITEAIMSEGGLKDKINRTIHDDITNNYVIQIEDIIEEKFNNLGNVDDIDQTLKEIYEIPDYWVSLIIDKDKIYRLVGEDEIKIEEIEM